MGKFKDKLKGRRKSTNVVGEDGAGWDLNAVKHNLPGQFARAQMDSRRISKNFGIKDPMVSMEEAGKRIKADAPRLAKEHEKIKQEGRKQMYKDNQKYIGETSEHLRNKTPVGKQKLTRKEEIENQLESVYRERYPETPMKRKNVDPNPKDFSFFKHKVVDKTGRKK